MPAIPCLGYPSKKAAIRALLDEGVDQPVIAKRCDTSAMVVYSEARLYAREKGGKPTGHDAVLTRQAERAERWKSIAEGQPWQVEGWNPAKVEKALRICAAAMGVIATALGVPVGQLVRLYCDRITPPMAGDKIELSAQIGQLDEATKAPQNITQNITAEPKPFQEPEVSPAQLYRFAAKGGVFLHMNGESMTPHKHLAWKGTAVQSVAVRRNHPGTKKFELVPVEKTESVNGR